MGLATPPKAEADAKRQQRPAGEAKITKKIKDRRPFLAQKTQNYELSGLTPF
jgi:hypothetical protein